MQQTGRSYSVYTMRVQVPKYKLSNQNQNYDSRYRSPTYSMFWYFGPIWDWLWATCLYFWEVRYAEQGFPSGPPPRPPKVPPLRALWSLLDGFWGVLKGSWGLLACSSVLGLSWFSGW